MKTVSWITNTAIISEKRKGELAAGLQLSSITLWTAYSHIWPACTEESVLVETTSQEEQGSLHFDKL